MRERDAILTLTGDHLSVTDRSGKTVILSVPYPSIKQALFFAVEAAEVEDA